MASRASLTSPIQVTRSRPQGDCCAWLARRFQDQHGMSRTIAGVCRSNGPCRRLGPELSLRGMVKPKFGHFGYKALVQLEHQLCLGVLRLPLPLTHVTVQRKDMIAGCGRCLELGSHGAICLVSEPTKELQDGLSASVVSGQYTGFDRMPGRVGGKERLQRFNIAFCESLVTAPNNGDVLRFVCAGAAHIRSLP